MSLDSPCNKEILFYDLAANFPVVGKDGFIYLAKNTNRTYRWNGSAYVLVGDGSSGGGGSSDVAWGNITGNITHQIDLQNALNLKASITYVDNLFNSTVRLKGTYNATTNTPDLTTSPNLHEAGDRYSVQVAGAFFGVSVEIGDDLTALIDNPTLVTDWAIIQANLTSQSIKTQYESNADTNAFTDAEQSKLAGVEPLAEVNNISDSNATDLTDGNSSTLHYHDSDRDRANHTGLQNSDTVTYTNSTPMPTTFGGLASGSTFDATPIETVLNSLLYPYQVPTISAFTISGQTTTLEVGDSVTSGNKTFTWSTTNSSNITANSLVIRDVTNAVDLATGLANDGSEIINFVSPISKTSSTSHTWRLTATPTQGANITRDYSVNWRLRMFYGESTNTSLTESQIEALRVSQLNTTANGTYAMAAGGYKYFAYPTSWGLRTTFKDTSTNLDVAMEAATTVSVTNSFGVTTNYYVHRTTNQLGGSINVQVS
jgi:hypothetical protein